MPAFPDGSTRRAFLVSGIAAASSFAARLPAFASGAACTLTPEQEEGPFYIPASNARTDLAFGQRGIPLALEFRVIDIATCAVIPRATVDIWHCDAMGVYSGFAELGGPDGPGGPGGRPPAFGNGFDAHRPHIGPPRRAMPHGGPPNGVPPNGMPPKMKPSNTTRFLRGVTATAGDGVARFETIFPGFYRGRVNHVHLKVRVPGTAGVVHTGQLFFPEEIASRISARAPYSAHQIRRTTLSEDGVFGGEHGSSGMGDLRAVGSDRRPAYVARLTLVVRKKARFD